MSAKHTVRSFDEELNYLTKKIVYMGEQAKSMIERAIKAIVQGDSNLARQVIRDDIFLNREERTIDKKAILIIARRQPMAVDLREIVGAIRISSDLERVGDMGKNIAKRVDVLINARPSISFYHRLEDFSVLALAQLSEVLDAYANHLPEKIGVIRERDKKIDATYTSLFQELLARMMDEPGKIMAYTHLLFCAKNVERIGDHATNIAETVHFITTGSYPSPDQLQDDHVYENGVGRILDV